MRHIRHFVSGRRTAWLVLGFFAAAATVIVMEAEPVAAQTSPEPATVGG